MQLSSSLWAMSSHKRAVSPKFVLSLACTSLLTVGAGLIGSAPVVAQLSPATQPAQLTQSQSRNLQRLPQDISRRVLQDAAWRSRVPISQLRISSATEHLFANSCTLEFGDRCSSVYAPVKGWEVIVNVKGQLWEYHVSRSGAQIALNPDTITEIPASTMPGAHIDAVIMDASRRAKVAPTAVRILESKAVTFANPCMLHFGEFCNRPAQPIEGYEVLAQVNGQTWKYHVDRSATRVVRDPKATTVPVSVTMPVALQTRILADAATRSGLPVASLQITQATQRSFSNACVFSFGEMCAMVYQPVEGWEAVVKVRDQSWTYHIDLTGTQLALDPRITNVGRLPVSVENAVLQNAKTWTGSPTVKIVAAKSQTWGNDCAFNFGKICPANFKPIEGWAVQVNTGNVEWTYHTNKDGSQVVMDRRVILPPQVAEAIARDIVKRTGPSVQPSSLRFLEVKEQSKRVCFLFGGCREEPVYLTVVSNGRQQWGYQSDDKGRQVLPVSVAQVLQAKDTTVSQR